MGARASLLAAGIACALACTASVAFECSDSGDCDGEGVCQPVGFCSFPDDGCESGQRYGDLAGSLSNMCVPLESAGTGETGADATGLPNDAGSSGGDAPATTDAVDDSVGATGPAESSGSPTAGDTTAETGGGLVVFRDDSLEDEFGAGEFLGTIWATDSVQVDAGPTGTFISRVYDAGAVTTWDAIEWQPGAPYDRPLPPTEGGDEGYLSGAVDMSENIVLLRFDEEGPWPNGAVVPDASGHGNDAMVIAGENGLPVVEGEFGLAAQDDMSTYMAMASSTDFDFGVSEFTWALWFRTTSDCVGDQSSANQAYLGIEDNGVDRAHLWLGCVRPSAAACGTNAGNGYAGGTFRSVHSVDVGSVCGTTDIVDGQWHHMALTKSGHANATLTLYVDGVAEDQIESTFAEPIAFEDGPDFAVGAFQDGSPQASAALDEIAIWRRAFTAEEVSDLYRRGAYSLRLQVRPCSDPDCADASWEGAAGPDSWFVDDGPGGPGPYPLRALRSSRYMQYQLSMEGPGTPLSPAAFGVTITGHQ
ncbi:MAG: LamG domain-containing protein [Myxococcota bacterium]